MLNDFLDLSHSETKQLCLRNGFSPVHADQLYRSVYKSLDGAPFDHRSLPTKLSKLLNANYTAQGPSAHSVVISRYDRSVKFLYSLYDGNKVEAVLIPEKSRLTVCLSSQVGCRQGCVFCQTGRMGLIRQLSAGEIVGQFLGIARWLAENMSWLSTMGLPLNTKVSNVVFMGMGEPLDNVQSIVKAIGILTQNFGADLSPRKISVSTAGHLEGLRELLRLVPNIRLALSLHAPNEQLRNKIMPINRKWSLQECIETIRHRSRKDPTLIQYTLIKNVNDSAENALELARLLTGLNVKVNLIPFNEIGPSRFQSPSAADVSLVRDILMENGYRVMVRYSKGQDINAACGQLYARDRLVNS